MTFKFVEGGSVHSLPWTELLTMDETPFVSIDDVTEGMNVMAPWYDDDSITSYPACTSYYSWPR